MASNKGRAFFGLSGYHFDPKIVTESLGLEPTSSDDAGMHGSLDKPVISTWEFSTEILDSDTQELDMYKLMDDDILKKIEGSKDKIIELCKAHNLSPRLGLVLTLSIDKDENAPAVGFGARVTKFASEIGAFLNVDYELEKRV